MSPSTLGEDLGRKKDLYERTFHTPDYFAYDPDGSALYGWRLIDRDYTPLEPDAAGRLGSAKLDAWLGRWEGEYLGQRATWLSLFNRDGNLLPTQGEAGLLEAQAGCRRAAELAAENEQLRADLGRLRG